MYLVFSAETLAKKAQALAHQNKSVDTKRTFSWTHVLRMRCWKLIPSEHSYVRTSVGMGTLCNSVFAGPTILAPPSPILIGHACLLNPAPSGLRKRGWQQIMIWWQISSALLQLYYLLHLTDDCGAWEYRDFAKGSPGPTGAFSGSSAKRGNKGIVRKKGNSGSAEQKKGTVTSERRNRGEV